MTEPKDPNQKPQQPREPQKPAPREVNQPNDPKRGDQRDGGMPRTSTGGRADQDSERPRSPAPEQRKPGSE